MTVSDTLFDDKGFIRDPDAWNRNMAQHLAEQRAGMSLSDDHWQLLEALRQHYFKTGTVPVMRHLCRDSGLHEHCVSELLENPRLAWQIAGLPDPGEEFRVYLETSEIPD